MADRKPSRKLRDVSGFQEAAAEVIRRCDPWPMKALIKQAGGWVPPPSIKTVTPPLLYNMAMGIQRNRWLGKERSQPEERGAEIIDFRTGRPQFDVAAHLRAKRPAPWLPCDLDFDFGLRERCNFEPNEHEFRCKDFGPEYVEEPIDPPFEVKR